jgi:Uma2 family endonuclease
MSTALQPNVGAAPLPWRAPRGDFMVTIPATAHTLSGFREWYATEDFPEDGRIVYLAGEIIIDMGHERLSSHVSLKGEFARALITLAQEMDVGRFFTDGARVVNETADLSSEPDGCYITWESVASGRVQFRRGMEDGDITEVIGAPDMVLEIVSPSSVRKDTVLLPPLYHRAGIPEYWLVDAQDEAITFEILHRTAAGYVPVVPADGWRHSRAFNRHFRLERTQNPIGIWQYRLLVQTPG